MRLTVPYCLKTNARYLSALGGTLLFFALTAPAFADEPFDMEPSSWMSFDRYKEKAASWIAPDDKAQAATQPIVVPPPVMPANLPNVTLPTRPVATAVMPGLNKDFDVRVSSTTDDYKMPNFLPSLNAGGKPAQEAIEGHWTDAADFARHNKQLKMSEIADENSKPLDIRFSFLPGATEPPPAPIAVAAPKVRVPQDELPKATLQKTADAAVPSPAPASPPVIIPPVAAAKPVPPPAPQKSAADLAACAALDAYKKRQLAAIESDRQTLTALQGAIAQLGLQKQLDFMPGANSRLSTQSVESGADMTVSSPAISGKN